MSAINNATTNFSASANMQKISESNGTSAAGPASKPSSKKAVAASVASLSSWIGAEVYPMGYPEKPFITATCTPTYIPNTADREYIKSISDSVFSIACYADSIFEAQRVTNGITEFSMVIPALLTIIPDHFRKFESDKKRGAEAQKDFEKRLIAVQSKDLNEKDYVVEVYSAIKSFPKDVVSTLKGVERVSSFALKQVNFSLERASYEAYRKSGFRLICETFSFFHLHEENALKDIFHTPDKSSIKKEWYKWGYDITETPQLGDLVVYSRRADANSVREEHFGIYEGNNKVVSKWGNWDIYRHDLGAVPLQYGESVVFYKKKIRFAAQHDLEKELQKIEEAMVSGKNASGHIAAASILTVLGQIEVCQRIFNEFLDLREPKMHPNSLFGSTCIPPLRHLFNKNITLLEAKLGKPPFNKMSKLQIVTMMKGFAYEAANDVKLTPKLLIQD